MSTTKDELLAALASVNDDMTHPTTVALPLLIVGFGKDEMGAYVNYLESHTILVEKNPGPANVEQENCNDGPWEVREANRYKEL